MSSGGCPGETFDRIPADCFKDEGQRQAALALITARDAAIEEERQLEAYIEALEPKLRAYHRHYLNRPGSAAAKSSKQDLMEFVQREIAYDDALRSRVAAFSVAELRSLRRQLPQYAAFRPATDRCGPTRQKSKKHFNWSRASGRQPMGWPHRPSFGWKTPSAIGPAREALLLPAARPASMSGGSMQFIVENGKFANALGLANGCVRASTIPILSHIAVSAKASVVTVRATNQEREIEVEAPAQVAIEGGVVLPGEVLAGLVRRLPKAGELALSLKGDRATIVSGAALFDLRTLPLVDFPEFREMPDDAVTFEVPCTDLKRLINETVYATYQGTMARLFERGVYLHVASNKLLAAATDSRRLALASADMPRGLPPCLESWCRPTRRKRLRNCWAIGRGCDAHRVAADV